MPGSSLANPQSASRRTSAEPELGISAVENCEDNQANKKMRRVRKKEPVVRAAAAVKDSTLLLSDNFMTVREFAELLKFSRSFVYELMEKGMPYLSSTGGTKKAARRIPVARASAWLERNMMP